MSEHIIDVSNGLSDKTKSVCINQFTNDLYKANNVLTTIEISGMFDSLAEYLYDIGYRRIDTKETRLYEQICN